MTAPSPTSRQERFEQLSGEINDLIARYPAMPPGRPQSICQSEIEKRLREIDDLNAEEYAEAIASKKKSSARGMSPYPGLGIAFILIVVGLIASSYTAILVGGIALLVSVGALTNSSSEEVESPVPASERFQWRP